MSPFESPPPSLRWGTRPPPSAELYVAIDGPCEQMSVFAVRDATLVHVGSHLLARVTDTGLDPAVQRGIGEPFDSRGDVILDAAGGRLDDLWFMIDGGGSVLHETSLVRRKDGRWKKIAPIGTDNVHYRPPESWRGGALGVALVIDRMHDVADYRIVGVDLPKGVDPTRLFPGASIGELVAMDSGEILASGRTPSGKSVVYLLGDDGPARQLRVEDRDVEIVGRSRAGARVHFGDARYRLEGNELVAEEVEKAAEWRSARDRVQHLVGAGYHDVELPPLPVSGVSRARFDRLTVAADGEAFVTVKWSGKSEIASDKTYYGLLRSRRPSEVYRCSEHVARGEGEAAGFVPSTETGFEPWPPRASATCETPFVIAFRYAERDRVPKDFPKARSTLAKHEISATLVEIASGSRRVIGARATSFADAQKLAAVLAGDLKIEPEIVCADPEPVRTIAADAR